MTADEITCRQFVEFVTDYFEGALAEPTLSHVEAHLVMCSCCVTYVEQMEATVEALRTLPRDPAPSELQRTIAARLGLPRA